MANEIVCVHHWSPCLDFGGHTPYRICEQCHGTWVEGDNEPRVVIGRLDNA